MGVASRRADGRVPTLKQPERRRRMLLRRLMVLCPVTETPVDTGYELSEAVSTRDRLRLVDCMECGQDHVWRVEEAFLE